MHLQLSLVCRFRLCRTLRDTFVPNVRQKFCFPLEVTFEHFYYFYFVNTKYIDFDHFPIILNTRNYLSLSTCSNMLNLCVQEQIRYIFR